MEKKVLKNGTVLEVGKKYCFKDSQCVVRPITITAIGKEYVLGIDSLAVDHLERVFEQMWKISYDWLPYEEEKKDKWYEYLHLNYESEEESRYVLWYSDRPRLANVIHLREWDSKQQMIEHLKK